MEPKVRIDYPELLASRSAFTSRPIVSLILEPRRGGPWSRIPFCHPPPRPVKGSGPDGDCSVSRSQRRPWMRLIQVGGLMPFPSRRPMYSLRGLSPPRTVLPFGRVIGDAACQPKPSSSRGCIARRWPAGIAPQRLARAVERSGMVGGDQVRPARSGSSTTFLEFDGLSLLLNEFGRLRQQRVAALQLAR